MLMGIELPAIDKEEERQLKIADCLEGMKYCDRRILSGDNAAIPVRDRYVVYLNKIGFNPKEMADEIE